MVVGLSAAMLVVLYPQKSFGIDPCYRPNKPRSHGAAERIRCTEKKKKISDPIESETHELLACSIEPQPSMLQLILGLINPTVNKKIMYIIH
jgi:hypothetical protein